MKILANFGICGLTNILNPGASQGQGQKAGHKHKGNFEVHDSLGFSKQLLGDSKPSWRFYDDFFRLEPLPNIVPEIW